ncbi:potassium-transporting ATPase subunit KdpC [Nitrospirillum sp. BR 11828]|uniref:potassium-transporting ATPase subunit KdpC n=1 Tax=Nitrospirillum sp. BR 11828 TaxID=3104325 RepID=UPI002ACA2235|nr:potassium-transporting ATPase subunit KdpC [Nitrospirillum sp. BR 11828]MDZ5648056.1 potassium-transporting ATPase subunit KdpC [Nitrospirillum sp. BR 11828]
MLKQIRPAISLALFFTVLCGLVYPLAMTRIAHVLFPRQAAGSLITSQDGTVVGSTLIGQNFTSEKYFWGRPSATTDTDPNDSTKTIAAPYNAANSMGSNLGPTSKALVDRIQGDAEKYGATKDHPVPVDLVTTSASGLDPDISAAGAYYQVARVAKARGMTEAAVRSLVDAHVEGRLLGLIGEPHVNVLALNRALDAAHPSGN